MTKNRGIFLRPGIFAILAGIALLVTAGWMYFSDVQETAAIDTAWSEIVRDHTTPAESSPLDRVIDFDALKAINPDTVAWIYIPGTYVDYPIVQASDNDFYLNRNFQRAHCRAGSIYLDAAASSDFSDFDTYIFGHHMRSGAMFGSLALFRDTNFLLNHPHIFIYTPRDSRKYALTEIGLVAATAVIDPPYGDLSTDHFITLATCEYDFDDARLFIRAELREIQIPPCI